MRSPPVICTGLIFNFLYLFIVQNSLYSALMNNTLLYATTILIWGSTWFAIEFQLGTVPPELSVVYRYGAASALLFLWCRVKGIKIRFPLQAHRWFVLLGVFLFGLNYVLAYRAQVHITSALTAITFSSVVWMNILNARIFFGVVSSRKTLFGAALGVIGVVLLFAPQVSDLSLSDGVFLGTVLSIGGAFLASLGNMVSQGAQRAGLSIVPSNAWGMFYGASFSAGIALTQGHQLVLDLSMQYLLSFAYLVLFGSIFAFGAYLTLIGRIGANRAGYAVIAAPVVATALSVAFEGLVLDTPSVLGMLLVLAGNISVLQPRTEPRAAALHTRATVEPSPTGKGSILPNCCDPHTESVP